MKIVEKGFTNANLLSVRVGTTGPCGGDSGHGGRVFLQIIDDGSTDLRIRVNDDKEQSVQKIALILGGDAEMETFLLALKFAVEHLSNPDLLQEESVL